MSPVKPPLSILVAVTMIGPLALNAFLPSMPGVQAVFDADFGTVQLTLTLYLVGVAFGQLAYGPLSDRFGRRPVLLIGLSIFVAGTIGAAVAPGIWWLIAARVLQAIGACSGLVISRAIVRDTHDRDQTASVIAYITMAMVVAPMLAPALGGLLDTWFGWRAAFLFVAVFGAAILAAAAFRLEETNFDRQSLPGVTGMLISYRSLLASTAFRGYMLQSSFSLAVFFAFLGGAPYVMMNILGRSTAEYGLYFMLVSVGYALGNFAAGRLSTRLGADRMILAGTLIAAAGAALLIGVVLVGWLSPIALFGLQGLIGLGNGLSLPNSMAAAVSVNPRIAGAAAGLSGFAQMGLGAAATLLVGHLLAQTALPLVLFMFAASVIAVVIHVGMTRAVTRRSETAKSAAQPAYGAD